MSAPTRPRLHPGLLWLPIALLAWIDLCGMVLNHKGLAADDRPLLGWLVGHRSGAWTAVMETTSSTVAVAILTIAVAGGALALTLRQRSLRPGATVALALGAAVVTGEVLKTLIGRSRPPVADMLGSAETGYGFPSNHTLATSAMVGALALVIWQASRRTATRVLAAALAVVVAADMGASRLYMGDHWLTDVLASYALAIAILGGVAWAAARYGRTWDRWGSPLLRLLPGGPPAARTPAA